MDSEHANNGPGQPHAIVKPGITVPLRVEGSVSVPEFPGTEFRVGLTFDTETLRYRVRHLSITNEDGVSTQDLHGYSIPELTQRLASTAIGMDSRVLFEKDMGYVFVEDVFSILDLEANRQRMANSGPTKETLTLVALIYAYGRAIGTSPNALVTTVCQIPKRTATRWIARARDEGLLDG